MSLGGLRIEGHGGDGPRRGAEDVGQLGAKGRRVMRLKVRLCGDQRRIHLLGRLDDETNANRSPDVVGGGDRPLRVDAKVGVAHHGIARCLHPHEAHRNHALGSERDWRGLRVGCPFFRLRNAAT